VCFFAAAGAASALSTFGTVASVASTVVGAYSAYQQSKATQQAYNYQAQVASNNAKTSELQAQDAIRRGDEEASALRQRIAATKSAQRVALASNGLDLSDGSALNVLSDTDVLGAQDVLTVKDNALKTAWGYRTQGANYQADAGLLSARASAESPWMAAGTSLLASAPTVADRWMRYRQTTA